MANEKDGWGKLLEHFRIDKNLLLKDIAKKADLTTTYFSAIESGDRDIPAGLTEKLAEAYQMDESQWEALHKAELARERKAVQINMTPVTDTAVKEVILNFAAKATGLTKDQAVRINNILNEGSALPYLRKEVK